MGDPIQLAMASVSACLVVGSGGLATGLALWTARRESARREQLEHLVHRQRQHARAAEQDLARTRGQRDEVQDSLMVVRAQLGLATAETARARDEVASLQGELEGLYEERDQRTARVSRLGDALAEVRARLEAARTERSNLEVRARAAEQTLAAIGVDLSEPPVDPLAPARRLASGEALRQLLLDAASEATALVDGRGLVQLGAGPAAAQERLAVAAAVIAELEPALATALCAPVSTASVAGPVRAQHLLRLDGSSLWLGVESHGEAPRFALQRTRLQLQGRPDPAPAAPAVPDAVGEGSLDLDPALTEAVRDWARQWQASDVVVLDAGTVVTARTEDSDPGAAVALCHGAAPLWRRCLRDHLPLPRVGLVASARDGTTVHVRAVADDLDTPLVVVVSPTPLPDEAVDELCGLVRWRAAPARQAS